MRKKILAMALAFTMACTAAGCLDSKPREQDDTNVKTTQVAEEKTEENKEAEAAEETEAGEGEDEFDGEEFKMPDPVTGDVDLNGLKFTVPDGWECISFPGNFSVTKQGANPEDQISISGMFTFINSIEPEIKPVTKEDALETFKNQFDMGDNSAEIPEGYTIKKLDEGELTIDGADAVYIDVLTKIEFEDYKYMGVTRQIITIGDNSCTFYINAGNKKELAEICEIFDKMSETMKLPTADDFKNLDMSEIGVG